MTKSNSWKFIAKAWEAILWLAAWIVAFFVSSKTSFPIDKVTVIVAFFFGIPVYILAGLYAIAEHRYGEYRGRKPIKEPHRGMWELLWFVVAIAVTLVWTLAYALPGRTPTITSTLASFAWARIFYFYLSSIDTKSRGSRKRS